MSTGAAIAVPAAFAALICRVPFIYLESVSRFDGPSLSGRIMEHLGFVSRYTQHHHWANEKWLPGPSVLGEFTSTINDHVKEPKNIFISLGTIKPYRFDRAVSALRKTIPSTANVRLQYGCTSGEYENWDANETISTRQFIENVRWADLVILHAGVGSALNILDEGKAPALLVRLSSRGEHVDDHQEQIARALSERGLAVVPDLDNLDWTTLCKASSLEVKKSEKLK